MTTPNELGDGRLDFDCKNKTRKSDLSFRLGKSSATVLNQNIDLQTKGGLRFNFKNLRVFQKVKGSLRAQTKQKIKHFVVCFFRNVRSKPCDTD